MNNIMIERERERERERESLAAWNIVGCEISTIHSIILEYQHIIIKIKLIIFKY